MSTKPVDRTMQYLGQAARQDPDRYIPYDELNARVRGPDDSALDESLLSFALEYLVHRGFAERKDNGYRLTSDGTTYLHARESENKLIYGFGALVLLFVLGFLGSSTRSCRPTPNGHPTEQPAIPSTASAEQVVPQVIPLEATAMFTPFLPHNVDVVRFQIGDQVVVIWSGEVNIRRTPGYVNKNASDICDSAKPGDQVQIIGGPEYEDNIWWWKIPSSRCGGVGWIAQSRYTGDALLDYP